MWPAPSGKPADRHRHVTYRPIKDGPRIAVTLAWWRDHRPNGLNDLVDAITQLYASS
jgi:hypothetical protein